MELFSSRRRRLDLPKQKAVVFVLNPKKYATHLTIGPIQLLISFY